jgi:hypothetical protein
MEASLRATNRRLSENMNASRTEAMKALMYQKSISAQRADCVSRPLLALMTIRARDDQGTFDSEYQNHLGAGDYALFAGKD